MATQNLLNAKAKKNDEFYTQYGDIQKEINAYIEYNPDVFRGKTILLPCDDPEWSNFTKFFAQNFENFGLKKLISTSYAADSKPVDIPYQLSLFETESEKYDEKKTRSHGKIFTLTRDKNASGKIDIDDLEWNYLEGDGDFRSDEIKALRDEADIIVTNPPFSLFREFLEWIVVADKNFLIIGNINCISYKEVFPLIAQNKAWLGNGMGRWISGFIVPDSYPLYGTEAKIDEDGNRIVATNNCLWLTNLEHGRRHQPLSLMTMEDNLKFSKHKEIKEHGYIKYDNYDAIEVPFTDSIPSDYDGVMGVPISFLDKYCPEQFEIVAFRKGNDGKDLVYSLSSCSQSVNVERERERERERETNSSTVLQNSHSQNSETSSQEVNEPPSAESLCTQEFSSATSIPGMIKNAEGKINGRITYARITIRKRKDLI